MLFSNIKWKLAEIHDFCFMAAKIKAECAMFLRRIKMTKMLKSEEVKLLIRAGDM